MGLNIQLIKLPDYNIIVSDEKVKEGYYYNELDKAVRINNPINHPYHKKVIASENSEHNLPGIDYNGLDDKFGIFDVESLTKEIWNNKETGVPYKLGAKELVKNAFIKSKELSDNKFTLEDLIKIAEYVRVSAKSTPEVKTKTIVEEYISLQKSMQEPKVFDINIEMERWDGNALTPYEERAYKPKIAGNKIKIVSLLSLKFTT